MTTYTEQFIDQIIEDYQRQVPKEYRQYEYHKKTYEEQFMEAIKDYRIGYKHITEVLDKLFKEVEDNGKYI